MTSIRVHSILDRSVVNGPGERCVIWVQGCTLNCSGCWNPQTWGPRGGALWTADDLIGHVLSLDHLDGVTLSGGEPFQQAEELIPFVRAVRAHGLTAMAYTGYEVQELVKPSQLELFGLLDIAVTGRYRKELRTFDAGWRGSTNQTIHWLSETADHAIPSARVELHLRPDGGVLVTGFPPEELLSGVREVTNSSPVLPTEPKLKSV